MRRCPPSARTAWRMCGLLGLLLAGCMPIGYVYPTISYVRPTSVGAARDEVAAFRVDIVDDENYFDTTEKDRYVLTPLPLNLDGSFEPQMKVGVDYGWVMNCVAAIYGSNTHHTVMVRLYRRGYHTLEVASWRKEGALRWKAAETPDEREQAIDELVSTWRTSPARLQNKYAAEGFVPPRDAVVFRYLSSGSASEGHLEALRFVAGEYHRLLSETTDAEIRARIEEKAKALAQIAKR